MVCLDWESVMARRKDKRLAPVDVARKGPGMHPDGWGLYLRVAASGSRSWIFRYRHGGRSTPRDMGLGRWPDVSLQEAREKARAVRVQKSGGLDPIDQTRAEKAAQAADRERSVTFQEAAERYILAQKAGWRSEKHAAQWEATLSTYAFPVLGKLPVQALDTALVLKVVEPLWDTKTETANRLRGRIEAVLDWATAREMRSGDNPARWKGLLQNLLPAKSRVQRVKHHTALAYGDIGRFISELRLQRGQAALALEFLILTAARTSEAVGATWAEIDLVAKTWTVPADRIKAGKEHRVPLSEPALNILSQTPETLRQGYLFHGQRKSAPLSNMAMMALLKRMGHGKLTVHGFRSTFRDWTAERTSYPREVAEMALAHAIGDKVEAAYRRGDLFEKRKKLMADWARYCDKLPVLTNVVDLRAAS